MAGEIAEQDWTSELQEQIKQAVANANRLQIIGGGSKAFYGNKSEGEALDVAGHSGIIDYDPAELVITLRGGCKLAEVEALLAEQGQMFGFEPPRYSEQATIGGAIASGLAGPRRAYAGGIRDFILGVKILDGRGEVLNFGGRVIKNVAGFDVSRLMVGAMGTLGVILEVSLRVIPTFETELTLGFEHKKDDQFIQWINDLGSLPLPISASMWHDGKSQIRLSGSKQGVASAAKKLGGDKLKDDWVQVKDQAHLFFKGHSCINRINIPATISFSMKQPLLIEWGGALRWFTGDCDVKRIRERLHDKHGSLCLMHRDANQSEPVFQALDNTTLSLNRSIKSRFDPAGILNRGRLYADL